MADNANAVKQRYQEASYLEVADAYELMGTGFTELNENPGAQTSSKKYINDKSSTWKTKDMVSGLGGVMNLAAASGEDLGTVSDIVTDALTAFGLKAQDSGHFADVLAKASSNSNTNVSMLPCLELLL